MTTELRQEVLDFLFGRIDYERTHVVSPGSREFKLDRMRELLARLGNPQQGLPIVHVAGTKGKGSTASMIASVLTASGHRTGVYSSPHLNRIEERAAVDGSPCEPRELIDLLQSIRPVVEEMDRELEEASWGPTFFEIATAMALLHFARREVDVAVLEVGLGGRLDSTNVCDPTVCVITSISFDHMKQLGNTLAAIAGEKAGIIKPGVPVISGVTHSEPATVIAEVAAKNGSELFCLGRDFLFDYGQRFSEESAPWEDTMLGRSGIHYWEPAHPAKRQASPTHNGSYSVDMDDLPVGLSGKHQAANAAVAVATLMRLERLGFAIPESAICKGLGGVVCPARVEIIGDRPAQVVDSAHNVASVEALNSTLSELFPNRPRVLLFATSNDKDIEGMLRLLLPEFQQVVFTRFGINPRAADPSNLLECAERLRGQLEGSRQLAACACVEDPREAWRQLMETATSDHVVCAAGSTFLAGEIRPLIVQPKPAQAT